MSLQAEKGLLSGWIFNNNNSRNRIHKSLKLILNLLIDVFKNE